jgi:hypothetical protein
VSCGVDEEEVVPEFLHSEGCGSAGEVHGGARGGGGGMTYESGYRAMMASGRDVVEGLLSGGKAALGDTVVCAGVKGAVGG